MTLSQDKVAAKADRYKRMLEAVEKAQAQAEQAQAELRTEYAKALEDMYSNARSKWYRCRDMKAFEFYEVITGERPLPSTHAPAETRERSVHVNQPQDAQHFEGHHQSQ